jgi:hypothetical protein
MKFRFVFWDVLPCKIIVDRRFRGMCCLHHQGDESSHVPLKRQSTIILQGSTSQKTNLNLIFSVVLPCLSDYKQPFAKLLLTRHRYLLCLPLAIAQYQDTLRVTALLHKTMYSLNSTQASKGRPVLLGYLSTMFQLQWKTRWEKDLDGDSQDTITASAWKKHEVQSVTFSAVVVWTRSFPNARVACQPRCCFAHFVIVKAQTGKSPLIGCPVICIWRVSPPRHTIRTHITNSQKENVFLRCPKCSSAGTHVNSVCSRTGSSTHKQICLNLSPTECSLYMFITLFAYVRSASGGNSLTQPL